MALTVGILIFDDVEVLDFCGPFEVFSVTHHLKPNIFQKVVLIAENEKIKTYGNMKVEADKILNENELPNLDVLIIPGGLGTRALMENEKVLSWVRAMSKKVKFLISVCTGVSIFGKCGLVDNMVITTHHLCYDLIGEACPNSRICKCRRYIDNSPVYTSAGISAGIDLSLYFIKKHFGVEIAKATVSHMEYKWSENEFQNPCTCGAEK